MTCFPSDTFEQYITLASPVSRGLSEITHSSHPNDPGELPDWVRFQDGPARRPTRVRSPNSILNPRACRRGRGLRLPSRESQIALVGADYTPPSSDLGEFALQACFGLPTTPRCREAHPLLHISTLGRVYCVIPQHTAAFWMVARQGSWARRRTPEHPKETLAIGLLTVLVEV